MQQIVPAAAVLLVVACGAPSEPTDVVTRLPDRAGPTTSADADATDGVVGTDPAGDHADTAQPATADPTSGSALDTVAAVLDAYGEVLGALSADPAGAPPPGSPALERWHGVVVADSPLSLAVLARLRDRATQDRVVVVPAPNGVSYRHHATQVRPRGPDVIEFDWCGWSPGIGRSLDTGQVVDDQVAHATGTGRVVRDARGWRLEALDQWDLTLLPAGAPDPCPAEPGRATP